MTAYFINNGGKEKQSGTLGLGGVAIASVSFLVLLSQTVMDLADGIYPLCPRDIWHLDGHQFLLQRRHDELSGWKWKGIQGLSL